MKPQAKTLIERQGFLDPDRTSSNHDDIHLWVFENLLEILKAVGAGAETFEIWNKEMEYPIIQSSPTYKSIVGFVDIYANGKVIDLSTKGEKQLHLCIEIKGKIPSCGDLIRQINFYKSFLFRGHRWIVVSPDDRFATILRSQGIYFYRFEGNLEC